MDSFNCQLDTSWSPLGGESMGDCLEEVGLQTCLLGIVLIFSIGSERARLNVWSIVT